MDRGIIIFVEGETDAEIYQEIKIFLRRKNGNREFDFKKIVVKNLKGIGNFKNKASGYCKKLLQENPNIDFTVFLCYDTDVFGAHKKPPIDRKKIEKSLRELKVNNVYHIKAKKSIEDWILCDIKGLKRHLRLPEKTKVTGLNGYEKLCNLFKKANKVYSKGSKVSGLVKSLDIEKITCNNCSSIKELCKILEVNCDKIKD
ncbi:hypothetical protein [Abyssisolibacter fermentans]|uniref:hypothetical protein n=1 Tax=Abyssisolibacter fermentans TaxID=1766203 RepID=UPI0008332D3F|nr:hypothetical protein [Abyssisolibacter fermentans]